MPQTEPQVKDGCPYDGSAFQFSGFFQYNRRTYFNKVSVTCSDGHRFNCSWQEAYQAQLLPGPNIDSIINPKTYVRLPQTLVPA